MPPQRPIRLGDIVQINDEGHAQPASDPTRPHIGIVLDPEENPPIPHRGMTYCDTDGVIRMWDGNEWMIVGPATPNEIVVVQDEDRAIRWPQNIEWLPPPLEQAADKDLDALGQIIGIQRKINELDSALRERMKRFLLNEPVDAIFEHPEERERFEQIMEELNDKHQQDKSDNREPK